MLKTINNKTLLSNSHVDEHKIGCLTKNVDTQKNVDKQNKNNKQKQQNKINKTKTTKQQQQNNNKTTTTKQQQARFSKKKTFVKNCVLHCNELWEEVMSQLLIKSD